MRLSKMRRVHPGRWGRITVIRYYVGHKLLGGYNNKPCRNCKYCKMFKIKGFIHKCLRKNILITRKELDNSCKFFKRNVRLVLKDGTSKVNWDSETFYKQGKWIPFPDID